MDDVDPVDGMDGSAMAGRLTIQRCAVAANRAERRTLDGRTHLVAPVVALVAGVVNGELVTADELASFAAAWNGRPVPLRHPQSAAGDYISANSPDVIESSVLGQVFGMHVEGDRLLGEVWLNEEKCRRLGGDALSAFQRLEQGEVLEVSTAYFCEIEEAAGTFNGKRYGGIQHNLRPDHVALLPDEVGACSIADGCGAGRVNQAEHVELPLPEDEGAGAPAAATVVNCSCSGGTMNEQEKQQAKVGKRSATDAGVQANEEGQQAEEVIEIEAVEVEGPALPPELTEFTEAVRAFGGVGALMEAVRSIKANNDREKAQIVTRLAANRRCAFSQAELEAFTLDQLAKLDASLTPVAASYLGRNGAALAANVGEELRPAKAGKKKEE